ncbi:hypothetical protein [Paramaledivibacter caminithermalis]|jgi:hypothetical protein|uniref:Uncharacterized protein n=1 Tax=Paramaledivibacter caminithermalis (strain DSM 15212 / CIP 107654 / DViRD3) TaxID=1121301 RepID=A0A1M6NKN4_PARC5|nr:hypothetical protein [Paramaledivibacter caminithermalis]SHJ96236.1 hypothetical protein SAMN02745912_01769 [Paramaledivibacter caminithermalis DSM 15212]
MSSNLFDGLLGGFGDDNNLLLLILLLFLLSGGNIFGNQSKHHCGPHC